MAEARIPVDLFNPGQVFACLGFMEAAELLLGEARGGFDWSDESDVCFVLHAAGSQHPVEAVLEFLANSEIRQIQPIGWPKPVLEHSERSDSFPSPLTDHVKNAADVEGATGTSLPIRLVHSNKPACDLFVQHWADGSSRDPFKLYAGNRSGYSIATAMLYGTRGKPSKKHPMGIQDKIGLKQLWDCDRANFVRNPLTTTAALGGSFNLDASSGWTRIDIGYSPDDQGHRLVASPVVQIVAAIGLEHVRPRQRKDQGEHARDREPNPKRYQYAAWNGSLPLLLARPCLASNLVVETLRTFIFELCLSGKSKVVSFAHRTVSESLP